LLNSFSHEETGNLNIISKIFMARSGWKLHSSIYKLW